LGLNQKMERLKRTKRLERDRLAHEVRIDYKLEFVLFSILSRTS